MSIFSRKQSVEIDYDKLADAIVKAQQKADTQTIKNAIIEAKEEIEKQEQIRNNQKHNKWLESIGINDNDSEKKKNWKTFKKLMVIKKGEIMPGNANSVLLKTITSVLYIFTEGVLYLLSVIIFGISLWLLSTDIYLTWKICFFPCLILLSFLFILIARVVRLARFEINELKDKIDLTSIFTSLTGLFALIVAIITIFVNKL